jgi:molybdenum cofactor cytidylyltransferase
MNLVDCIQPVGPARIAIVGAGGKTTALFQLARKIPGPAWVTTTTHLGTDQLDLADRHFIVNSKNDLKTDLFKAQKVTLITGAYTPDDRVRGPDPEMLDCLRQAADREGVSLIVEADGSRSRPLKAPAEHEPAIPEWARCVIFVVGLSALDKPLNEQWVCRPSHFSRVTGLSEGDLITTESLVSLCIHPQGGLKGIPPKAMRVALLNQADTEETRIRAKSVVQKILAGGYDKIIVGSLTAAPDSLECYLN